MSNTDVARVAVLKVKSAFDRLVGSLPDGPAAHLTKEEIFRLCATAARPFVTDDIPLSDADVEEVLVAHLKAAYPSIFRAIVKQQSSRRSTPRSARRPEDRGPASPIGSASEPVITNEPKILFLPKLQVHAVEAVKEYLDAYHRSGHIADEEYPVIVIRIAKAFCERREKQKQAGEVRSNEDEVSGADREWIASAVRVESSAFVHAHSVAQPPGVTSGDNSVMSSFRLPQSPLFADRGANSQHNLYNDRSAAAEGGGSPFEHHLRQLRRLASGHSGNSPQTTQVAAAQPAVKSLSPVAAERLKRRSELAKSIGSLTSKIGLLTAQLQTEVDELNALSE
jgi:hypothetical protein